LGGLGDLKPSVQGIENFNWEHQAEYGVNMLTAKFYCYHTQETNERFIPSAASLYLST